jgi:hypothetical protein
MKLIRSNEPQLHSLNIQSALTQIVSHLEYDVTIVQDLRLQALMETSREVLKALSKSFEDFDKGCEPGWGGSAHK